MRQLIKIIWIFFLFPYPLRAQYYPEKAFPVLFRDVQMSGIFSDSKTFADAVPLRSEQAIKKSYRKQRKKKSFELERFVYENFLLPSPPHTDTLLKSTDIRTHIEKVWLLLERPPIVTDQGTLLALPYPYIVPGGRFNEIYYWDSYFTMIGLQISGKNEAIKNMIDNFAYLIDRFGFIPNGNRSYYLTRSQPPFFAMMVDLWAKQKGNDVYVHYQPQLLKEYKFWMNGVEKLNEEKTSYKRVVRINNKTILNRYWDDSNTPRPESFLEDFMLGNRRDSADLYREIRAACESGWDFSSRWMKDTISFISIHTTDIIPVDLNCLLYHYENTIMQSYLYSGDTIQAQIYSDKARLRKDAIIKYLWNDSLNFFTDFNFKTGYATNVISMAGMFPLFFKIASTDQAQNASIVLQKKLLYTGGLVTTPTITNQQWDAPNGWAPMQYIGYESMKRYQKHALADTIAHRWLRTVEYSYNQTGKLLEKYNVRTPTIPGGGGEYPNQDGFGWTNGIYLYLKKETSY